MNRFYVYKNIVDKEDFKAKDARLFESMMNREYDNDYWSLLEDITSLYQKSDSDYYTELNRNVDIVIDHYNNLKDDYELDIHRKCVSMLRLDKKREAQKLIIDGLNDLKPSL